MIRVMHEEEIGEIQDELKALREDLKIVVRYSNSLRSSVIAVAIKTAIPALTKLR